MKKSIAILAAILAVLGIGGYAAGLFTQDVAVRESCVICRATRYSGHRYGFAYQRIEDSPLTTWYRQNIETEHGRDGGHAHVWSPSGCPVYAAPGVGDLEAACPTVAPILFLKPETELAVLQAAPDNRTRQAIIESLNVPDRRMALERVKLLVEYVYVYQSTTPWSAWWQRNGAYFATRTADAR